MNSRSEWRAVYIRVSSSGVRRQAFSELGELLFEREYGKTRPPIPVAVRMFSQTPARIRSDKGAQLFATSYFEQPQSGGEGSSSGRSVISTCTDTVALAP